VPEVVLHRGRHENRLYTVAERHEAFAEPVDRDQSVRRELERTMSKHLATDQRQEHSVALDQGIDLGP